MSSSRSPHASRLRARTRSRKRTPACSRFCRAAVERDARAQRPAAPARPVCGARHSPRSCCCSSSRAVNHYRDELAVNPRLHRPLTALYGSSAYARAALGPVRLRSAPAGRLCAAAESRAAHRACQRQERCAQPQPLPLLRVTLLDRFGNRLAARDVPPRAYLLVRAGCRRPAALRRARRCADRVRRSRQQCGRLRDRCLPARGQRARALRQRRRGPMTPMRIGPYAAARARGARADGRRHRPAVSHTRAASSAPALPHRRC